MLIRDGKAYWAKIVGNPVPGYDKTQKEWSFDLALATATIDGVDAAKALRKAGLGRYIKNKEDDRGDFVHLKRKAMKRDPQDATKLVPAEPIRIVDHRGEPWQKRLIGNGSTLNVSVAVNENPGNNGKTQLFMSPMSVQVWEHVPYKPKDGFPTREDPVETTVSEDVSSPTKEW